MACGVISKLRAAVDSVLSIETRTFGTHGTWLVAAIA
jgi:hypothetical protein